MLGILSTNILKCNVLTTIW